MREKLVGYALDMLRLWQSVRDAANPWHNVHICQAYQDSLQGLRHYGLIEEYKVEPVAVKIKGIWYE